MECDITKKPTGIAKQEEILGPLVKKKKKGLIKLEIFSEPCTNQHSNLECPQGPLAWL